MSKSSIRRDSVFFREPQAVGLRQGAAGEWTYEGKANGGSAQ